MLPGQDMITGTAIGHVRDQTNNRIYWFTTSDTSDAIHEFDMNTNSVTTLIQEPKAREAALPTCVPELQSRITDPQGNFGTREPAPMLPDPPRGTCMTPGDVNFDASGDFSDPSRCGGIPQSFCGDPGFVEYDSRAGTSALFERDDSLCVTPVSSGSDYTCSLAGSGSHGITIASDGTVSNPNSVSFVWTDGSAPTDNSAPGSMPISHQITITYTIPTMDPPYDNASDGSIECIETVVQPGADPLVPFTFTFTTAASTVTGVTTNGSASIPGANVGTSVNVNETSGVAIDEPTVNEFTGTPTAAVAYTGTEDGADLTFTQTGNTATLVGTVDAGGTATVTWSNIGIQAIPVGNPPTLNITTSANNGFGNTAGTNVHVDVLDPGDSAITFMQLQYVADTTDFSNPLVAYTQNIGDDFIVELTQNSSTGSTANPETPDAIFIIGAGNWRVRAVARNSDGTTISTVLSIVI